MALVGLLVGGGLAYWAMSLGNSTFGERFTRAKVASVVDGDTIVLSSGEQVRYIGIDTPEIFGEPECGGEAATELNRQLLKAGSVDLLPGPEEYDRFERLLRYVFADGVFVNAELVNQGLAHAQTYHPQERFAQVLTQLEAGARAANRGSWQACDWP